MKPGILVPVVIASLVPVAAFGQIGVGARAGTLGLGPELSIQLAGPVTIRGGVGFLPFEFEHTFSNIDYTLDPPTAIWNIGIDFYPGLGSFHLSAGLLHRPHYDLSGDRTGSTVVGNQTYTGSIHFDGTIENANQTAPFVSIGFGRTASRGFGLFIDIGAAFVGEADIELTGTCSVSTGSPCPGNFQSDLEEEERQAEADVGRFLKLHPILQIGLRIGTGR